MARSVLPETPAYRPAEPNVAAVLFVQFGLFMLCAGLFGILSLLAGWADGPVLTADAAVADRWQTRAQLGLGHFLSFTVAGFLTVWVFYRRISGGGRDWQDYLQVRHLPGMNIAVLTILLMAVSIPLVLFSLNINQMIPLPEMFQTTEAQTEEMLKGLLKMDNTGELLANLVVIALLPAIGEEIVFRGVVQQQLMRRIANPWVALVISAAVFSFIHLQFEGFLPRLILGLLLGWLYWQTRNFWVPVLAHFFNNALQVVGQYLYGKEVSTVDFEQDIQVPWFAAVLSLLMVLAAMSLIRRTIRE